VLVVVATLLKVPALPVVLRQISYPARPLPPLSVDPVHERDILRLPPDATRLVGSDGELPGVVAEATFDGGESPPALVAITR
jgi:hypothetical protein